MSDDKNFYLRDELYALVRRAPQVFDFLQEGALDGVWYWDIENPEAEWLSPRFKEVFGYSDDEVPNTSAWWQENIFPEDLEIALDNYEKHVADPDHPYDQIVRYRHKDGSTVWVRCRGMAVRNGEGDPIRMIGAHTDVTPLMQMEETIADAYAQLAASNRQLKHCAGIVSNELVEPLHSIYDVCEMLKSEYGDTLDENAQKYLDIAIRNALRVREMVNDLHDALAQQGNSTAN